ncbi:MAG: DUF1559 domain-containing protein [Planctomycetes bacterium]|nr:DUF1559 domain-containing protein [Planctomycetota bacterium]
MGERHHFGLRVLTHIPADTAISCALSGRTYACDFTSSRLGLAITHSTCTVFTAGRYHPGGVHTLMRDGSMRLVSSSIDLGI